MLECAQDLSLSKQAFLISIKCASYISVTCKHLQYTDGDATACGVSAWAAAGLVYDTVCNSTDLFDPAVFEILEEAMSGSGVDLASSSVQE